jgi:hypothetical protein
MTRMRSSGLLSDKSGPRFANEGSYEAEMEAENAEGEEGADGEIDETMIIVSRSTQPVAHQTSLPIMGTVIRPLITHCRSPTRPQKERNNGQGGRRSQMRFE